MKKTLMVVAMSAVLGGVVTQAFAEAQPHMKAAKLHLKQAEGALEKASHDKGGHRVKALELIRAAIAEVEAGMDFDNKH